MDIMIDSEEPPHFYCKGRILQANKIAQDGFGHVFDTVGDTAERLVRVGTAIRLLQQRRFSLRKTVEMHVDGSCKPM